MQITALLRKYRHVLLYGIFGVLTTVVNIVVYWVMAHLLHLTTTPSTLIAWVAAVLFAYLTNRKWVFDSQAEGNKQILAELISFFLCRIATGVVDWLCMFAFVDLLHLNDVLIKAAANVLVITLNFIASKWLIFKKKEKNNDETV